MRKTVLLLSVVALVVLGSGQQSMAQEMALKTNLLYDATTTLNLGYEVALNRKTTLDIWVNYNPWTLGSKWVGLDMPNDPSASRRDAKLKHLAIQPEVRWWMCEKFNGHFFGAHLHGGLFNVGALKLPFDWGRYKDKNGNFYGNYKSVTPIGHPGQQIHGVAYQMWVPEDGSPVPNEERWKNADNDGIFINSYEGWFVGAGVSYGYHWIIAPRFSMEFTLGVGYAYLNYDKNRCTDCKVKIQDGDRHYFGPTRAGVSLLFMLK